LECQPPPERRGGIWPRPDTKRTPPATRHRVEKPFIGKRWQMLHRLIYFSAVLGVIHYYWLVKSAVLKPLIYGAIVALLLLWRFLESISKKIRLPREPWVRALRH
jgi:DMSO/TMAO reductase YedYZ heme-binding membrane subunit